jgi:hypothetical protein
MLGLLVIWAALLVALFLFAIGRPGRAGALTLSYFLGLSLIHVPGVLPFLDPESGLPDFDETRLGFEMTILGMGAFVVGAVLARWMDRRQMPTKGMPPEQRAQAFERLGRRVLALGIVAYFVLLPVSGRVPSMTSIVAAFGTLLILGLWLVFYGATMSAYRTRMLTTLALLPLLPLPTLVIGGFLGFGVLWVLSVVAFLFVITRRRIWFYVAAPPVVFLGLALFVTYMGQRTGYRELLREGQAGMFERLDRLSALVTDFQFLDLASPDHVAALDARLNQNWLVGAAIMYHEDGAVPFAYGGTVPLWALIPRAVWPGKPEIGGGGNVVSEFTGIRFAEGSSFGTGQALEFYINFGVPGVLIGFLGLGFLLMRLDQGIMRSLAADDIRGLMLRAMPGLMLLSPGGNLLEILVGCVAGYVAAHLLISLKLFNVRLPTRLRRLAA